MGKEGDFSVACYIRFAVYSVLQVWFGASYDFSSIALICESKRQWKSKFGAVQWWPQKGQHLHCGQPRALEGGPCFPSSPSPTPGRRH